MADLNSQIRNDQSIASASAVANRTLPSPNSFLPPVNIQRAKTNIDNLQSIQSMIFPVDLPKYRMAMFVSDYSRQSLTTIGRLNLIGSLALPLPTQLTDGNHVDYGESSLGVFGAAAQPILEANPGLMKSIKSSTQNLINSGPNLSADQIGGAVTGTFNQLTGNSNTVYNSIVGGLANLFTTNSETAGNILGVLGYSPNQFLTILLKGPQYKRHQFLWKFSPRNATESRNLRLIIQSLNNWKAPGLTLGGALFTFPKIFSIAILPNSSFMYKFKPAVLEDITIDYMGSGTPAFYRASPETGGLNAPESVSISMSFIELEYWMSGDYMNVNADGSADNDPFHTVGPRGPT